MIVVVGMALGLASAVAMGLTKKPLPLVAARSIR
jgi:hypothetical protein